MSKEKDICKTFPGNPNEEMRAKKTKIKKIACPCPNPMRFLSHSLSHPSGFFAKKRKKEKRITDCMSLKEFSSIEFGMSKRRIC
jgi:hypothetical protein